MGDFFEATPDDAFGEFFGRGDVPDELPGFVFGGVKQFGDGEFGFAEAAAGYEDPEALRRVEDLELTWVETEFECANGRVGRGWRVMHGVSEKRDRAVTESEIAGETACATLPTLPTNSIGQRWRGFSFGQASGLAGCLGP
jgi:hypothetical protein